MERSDEEGNGKEQNEEGEKQENLKKKEYASDGRLGEGKHAENYAYSNRMQKNHE